MKPPACSTWFLCAAMFPLLACDATREGTESLIPRDYWGVYAGTQPAYDLRDPDNKVIVLNGKTLTVPAINNTVEIASRGISWQQEAQDGEGRRTVKYERAVPTTIESTREFLLVECRFTTPDGGSNPARRFKFDRASGRVVMLGDSGSADCVLQKQ